MMQISTFEINETHVEKFIQLNILLLLIFFPCFEDLIINRYCLYLRARVYACVCACRCVHFIVRVILCVCILSCACVDAFKLAFVLVCVRLRACACVCAQVRWLACDCVWLCAFVSVHAHVVSVRMWARVLARFCGCTTIHGCRQLGKRIATNSLINKEIKSNFFRA